MRDRLIELIQQAKKHTREANSDVERNMIFAEYLLANSVIVPPCKVGDEVYCIIAKGGLSGGLIFTGHIIKRKVDKLIFDGVRWEMMSDRVYPDFKDGNGLIYAYFGDLVFVSENEAKSRLKELLDIGVKMKGGEG